LNAANFAKGSKENISKRKNEVIFVNSAISTVSPKSQNNSVQTLGSLIWCARRVIMAV